MSIRRNIRAGQFIPKGRRLNHEKLEDRNLLASDWQNPFNPWDVDDSGQVDPRDALIVINDLSEFGSHSLQPGAAVSNPPVYIDVDGSNSVEPRDALIVIDRLNEPAQPPAPVQRFATQRFHANINTGVVTAVPIYGPQTDGSEAEATFAGNNIGFNLSTILDEPGDSGRKVINVSLTNHSNEPIGQLPDGSQTGVRVLFSPFAQFNPSADLRSRTGVSTLAGTGVAGSTNGDTLTATFNHPVGSIADGHGNLYVTDFSGNRIRMISGGTVTTLAGSGALGGTNGVGAAASFNGPYGIARNPIDGALIVTDFNGNRIRRIMPDGSVTTVAGTGTAGDVDGTGNVATFRNPIGVAVDSAGVIYVTEHTGQRVRKIVMSGSDPQLATSYTVSVLAGSAVSPPVAGFANGASSAARFNSPRGITVDENGVLYVADAGNNRLRRVTGAGAVTTIGGTGAAGSADGSANVATFNAPGGIAVVGDYSTTLLVSDISGRNIRQVVLRSGGDPNVAADWRVSTLAGTGIAGSSDGPGNTSSFDTPVGISVDGPRRAYIADNGNNKIRQLSVPNGFPASIDPVQLANADGSFPVPSPFLADLQNPILNGILPYIEYEGVFANGATTPVQPWVFIVPSDVVAFEFTAKVEANTPFLAPPFGISRSSPNGGVGSPENMVRTVAGQGLGGYVNGLATEAKFSGANGITIDAAGNQYVADAQNNAIRRVTPDGFVSTVAGVAGRGPGSTNGAGNVAQFNGPAGVAIAQDGTIFVADTFNNTIRRIIFLGGDATNPSNWYVSTIAGLVGSNTYVDNTTGDLARFASPYGITVTDGNIVYVSEFSGNRIRRLQFIGGSPDSSTSWQVSLVAGSTAAPLGTAGTTDGQGTSARFSSPAHIAVDRNGLIYVADQANNRIRRILPDGTVWTLAGSEIGFADGVGTAAQFEQPFGVAVDTAGYIYATDSSHRIRRISPSGVVTTVAGTRNIGDVDGTGDVATFYYPQGIAVDDSGSLHVISGGQYDFTGGGFVISPGLRIRLIQRIKK